MGIVQTRRDIKRLKARRANLATVIADKVEERRRLSEVLRSKKDRDPAQQERKEELHREILLLGEEVEQTSQEIDRRRGRRGVVTKKLAKLARKLRRQLSRRSGPDKALRAAKKDNGKHEEPPGSNWGPWVSKVIRFTGYSGPVYWCGCAACWWTVKKAGGEAPSRIRRGYAGYIADDARAGVNGLRQVASPVKGGYATLWGYEHIVMTTGRVSADNFETWEGNTSASDGSQSNGGEVANKWRPLADADVFAAQTY